LFRLAHLGVTNALASLRDGCNLAGWVYVGVTLWPRAVFGRVIWGWPGGVRQAMPLDSEAE
jgi:hypothetical protein